ncbi:MAG: tetratricopeptide repeat protein [Candidatus Omnitrophica bacterium]|nr:tetratricopeptide repeat protein [Candidatus Omnitrophota bacterium]
MITYSSFWPKVLLPVMLVMLGLAVYINSLSGDFQFDDHPVIVHNEALRAGSPAGLWAALPHPSRAVAYLTFWMNYRLGGPEPFGFHIVNLLIHLINTLLVYALVLALAGTPAVQRGRGTDGAYGLAFTAAALFVCHPLNTQAVSYITQRFTSLAALFYLATLWCYLRGRLSAVGTGRAGWWAAALISALCGMFTKQIALTVPLMIILLEFAFFDRRRPGAAAGLLITALLTGAVIPALYHFRADRILSITHENGNHPGDIINAGTYALTQPRVVATYLRLLVWPAGQTLLYDFPVTAGWTDPRMLVSAAVLALLFCAALVLWDRARLVSVGILWFFIVLLVEATVIPIRHVIFEHRAYLPSVGLLLAVAWALHTGIRSRPARVAVTAGLIAVLSVLTVQRNRVWQSGVAMWTDVVRKTPDNARAHYNLAYEYLKAGNPAAALDHFNKAVLIDPDYELAYVNRSQLLLDIGNLELALHDINRVLKLNPRRAGAYLNRGAILLQAKRYDEALDDFEKAHRLDPTMNGATVNRALVMGHLGRYADGLRLLNEMKDVDADAKFYNVRGALLMGVNDLTGALESFSAGIAHDPALAELYRNRAQVFQALGRYERAEEDLTVLIARGKGTAEVYLQRAYVRTRLQRLAGALDDYGAVARQRPGLVKVYLERGKIYYRQGEFRRAAQELDLYLKQTPRAADAFMLRGLSHYELRDFNQALADFKQARDLGYDVDDTYFDRTRKAMGSI